MNDYNTGTCSPALRAGSFDRETLAVCISMVSMAVGERIWESLKNRRSPEVLGMDYQSPAYTKTCIHEFSTRSMTEY